VREAVSRWQVAHRRAVMVAKRRRRCPQEHGGVAQRAPAGRGGPRRSDAGRAFVSVSGSSASVRSPVSGAGVQQHACLSTRPLSGVRCGRLSVQVSGVRRGVWLGPAQGTAGRDRSRAITSIPDRWKGQDQSDGGGRGARLGQSVTSVRKLSRPLPHVRIEPRRPGAQESLLPKADTGNSLGCSEFSGTETETRDKEVGLEAHPVYRHRGPARPGA
jgi:hypothetical protein